MPLAGSLATISTNGSPRTNDRTAKRAFGDPFAFGAVITNARGLSDVTLRISSPVVSDVKLIATPAVPGTSPSSASTSVIDPSGGGAVPLQNAAEIASP